MCLRARYQIVSTEGSVCLRAFCHMLGTLRAMILRACYEIYSTSTDTDILLPGSSKLACATASLPLLFNAFRTFRDATLPCFVLVPRSGSVPVLPRYRRVVTMFVLLERMVVRRRYYQFVQAWY